MTFMRRPRRAVGFSKAALLIAFVALLLVLQSNAKQWDREGASEAFEDATRKRSELSKTDLPVLSQYLECARTYRKVHVLDPHYRRTGDAIYEEGVLYQEMGDKFSDSSFYRTAVRRFELLIKDYGGNRNCPDGLLRTGDIYLKSLNDEIAAQNSYKMLRAKYRNSAAARQLKTRAIPSIPPTPLTKAPVPYAPRIETTPSSAQASPNAGATVQSIRHWSTNDYTRVIVGLNSSAIYSENRLPDPERIYFDISKAKLSPDLQTKILSIDDSMLKQIRISQFDPETVRMVLDLAAKGKSRVSELHNPSRIVIDILSPNESDAPSSASLNISDSKPAPADSEITRGENVLTDAAQSLSKQSVSAATRQPSQSSVKQPSGDVTEVQSGPLNASKEAIPASQPSAAAKLRQPKGNAQASLAKPPDIAQASDASKTEKPSIEKESGLVSAKNNLPPAAVASASREKETAAKAAVTPTQPQPSTYRPAEPTSLGDRTLTRMLGLKIGRIVIDPGHGGNDLGTVGPGGLLEKDLVLAIALELQSLLQNELGAQVLLTRTDDTFISLEERSALANSFRADLFISIHANSSRSLSTSGVETYYLNFAKTTAEREIAARENATSTSTISDLDNLIKKIAQADRSTESKELATILQNKLYLGVKKMLPKAQNRGVRSAPFIVLLGANMPSILTEVGFISNPRDERILKKSTNQQRLVKALFSGIESYMKTLGSDVAQNQP